MRRPSPEHVKAEVQAACHTPGGPVAVERAVAERLRAAVSFDAWCTLTIDPASVLPTGGFHEQGVPAPLLPQLVQIIEARTEDALALPTLARQTGRTATLSDATHGRLDLSQRYREILRPAGLEHELRLLFRIDAGLWGVLIVFRGPDVPDFSPGEADLLEGATKGVAAAIRREMVLTEIEHPHDPDGPGLLLLSAALDPLHVTPSAQQWLSEIEDGVDPGRQIPYGVVTLAARALGGVPATGSLRSRIRARTGQWLTLHAERLPGDPPVVSIIIDASRPTEIARLVADAYQLTIRERDVVRLLVSGYSRHEMARLLALSPHTIDDHIKRVFGKLQVRSRSELTYRLFFDQHAPRINSDVPIGASGWFLR